MTTGADQEPPVQGTMAGAGVEVAGATVAGGGGEVVMIAGMCMGVSTSLGVSMGTALPFAEAKASSTFFRCSSYRSLSLANAPLEPARSTKGSLSSSAESESTRARLRDRRDK